MTEMQGLSNCVEEAEFREETVEDWAAEATVARCKCLEQQGKLHENLTDLECLSRRNNIRIFGVAEGEEGSY